MVVSTFIEIIPLVQRYYREKILPETNSNNICFSDISRTFFHGRLPVTNKHGRFPVTNEQERCGENLPSLEPEGQKFRTATLNYQCAEFFDRLSQNQHCFRIRIGIYHGGEMSHMAASNIHPQCRET